MTSRAQVLPHFWEAPYRPLFLASYLWAFAVLSVWPLGDRFGVPMPRFEPMVLWHVHELLFGFTSAAIGGYLLTALPNWVHRPPEQGAVLKALLAVWIIARISVACADILPGVLLVPANALFFLLLAVLILVRTIRAGAWRKAMFGGGILCMGACDCVFLTAAQQGRVGDALNVAYALLIGQAVLVLVVGSRIIPAFTRNWLNGIPTQKPITGDAWISRRCALGALVIALVGMLMDRQQLTGIFLISAGFLTLWNMRGWRLATALGNPLLAGLHMSYLWLPVGLIAIGVLTLFPVGYPIAGARHLLAIGAVSGLILAVSGRAASHAGPGDLRAGGFLVLGMALVWVATPVRVAAPLFPVATADIETAAALLWCAGWAFGLIGFMPALIGPAVRPVLSGPTHKSA